MFRDQNIGRGKETTRTYVVGTPEYEAYKAEKITKEKRYAPMEPGLVRVQELLKELSEATGNPEKSKIHTKHVEGIGTTYTTLDLLSNFEDGWVKRHADVVRQFRENRHSDIPVKSTGYIAEDNRTAMEIYEYRDSISPVLTIFVGPNDSDDQTELLTYCPTLKDGDTKSVRIFGDPDLDEQQVSKVANNLLPRIISELEGLKRDLEIDNSMERHSKEVKKPSRGENKISVQNNAGEARTAEKVVNRSAHTSSHSSVVQAPREMAKLFGHLWNLHIALKFTEGYKQSGRSGRSEFAGYSMDDLSYITGKSDRHAFTMELESGNIRRVGSISTYTHDATGAVIDLRMTEDRKRYQFTVSANGEDVLKFETADLRNYPKIISGSFEQAIEGTFVKPLDEYTFENVEREVGAAFLKDIERIPVHVEKAKIAHQEMLEEQKRDRSADIDSKLDGI
jgi:hypothetical protein